MSDARRRIFERRTQFIAAAVASVAASCSSLTGEPEACLSAPFVCNDSTVPNIKIGPAPSQPDPSLLCPGDKVRFEATRDLLCEGDAGSATVWRSANTAVAVVNELGEVTAVGQGSTVITATIDGKSDYANVRVLPCGDAGADARSD